MDGILLLLEAFKSWMGFKNNNFGGSQIMDGKSFPIQCFFSAVFYDAIVTFHPA